VWFGVWRGTLLASRRCMGTLTTHTLSPIQRSLVGTVIALILLALLVKWMLPLLNGRELYFATFGSSPFPGM